MRAVRSAVHLITGLMICGSTGCGAPPGDAQDQEQTAAQELRPAGLVARFPARSDSVLIERGAALAVMDGEVFVLDGLADRVLRFSATGEPLATIGGPGEGPGELAGVSALHVTGEGTVWVASVRSLRLTGFDRQGRVIAEHRTPYPVSAFGVLRGPRLVIPTPYPEAPLAALEARADTSLLSATGVPRELASPAIERLRFRGVLMASEPGGVIWFLQNHDPAGAGLWRFTVSSDPPGLADIESVPLPRWLREALVEESIALRSRESSGRPDGSLEMIPYKGLLAGDHGRVWLNPDPSHRVMALSPPRTATDSLLVVRPSDRQEHRGMLQAVVSGGKLVALYETEVRVYSLTRIGSEQVSAEFP